MKAETEDSEDQITQRKSGVKKLSRKAGEKLRRDRLNGYIAELATEIPIIAQSRRRLDKAAILRLTVAYMKFHHGIKRRKMQQKWKKGFISELCFSQLFREVTDGFLLVVSQDGTVMYVSTEIANILGHSQTDIIGTRIHSIVHPDDQCLFESQFDNEPHRKMVVCHSSEAETNAPTPNINIMGLKTCSFFARLQLGSPRSVENEEASYELVHVVGQVEHDHTESLGISNEPWLVAVVRLARAQKLRDMFIRLSEIVKNHEWTSEHSMDGVIIKTDKRSSLIHGFMPCEIIGKTPYMLINEEDLHYVAHSHVNLLKENEVPCTIWRLKTRYNQSIFVKSSSVIVIDDWTKEHKVIISVNTVLRNDEGQALLKEQRKRVDAVIKATQALSVDNKSSQEILDGEKNEEMMGGKLVTDKDSIESSEDNCTSLSVGSPVLDCNNSPLDDLESGSSNKYDSDFGSSIHTSGSVSSSPDVSDVGFLQSPLTTEEFAVPSPDSVLFASSEESSRCSSENQSTISHSDLQGTSRKRKLYNTRPCDKLQQYNGHDDGTGFSYEFSGHSSKSRTQSSHDRKCCLPTENTSDIRNRQTHQKSSGIKNLLRDRDPDVQKVLESDSDHSLASNSQTDLMVGKNLSGNLQEIQTDATTKGMKGIQSPTVDSSLQPNENVHSQVHIRLASQLDMKHQQMRKTLQQQVDMIASLQSQLENSVMTGLSAEQSLMHTTLLQRLTSAKDSAKLQQSCLGQLISDFNGQSDRSGQNIQHKT